MGYDERIKGLGTELQTLTNTTKAKYAELEAKGDAATGDERTALNTMIDDGIAKRKELEQLKALDDNDKFVNQAAAPKANSRNAAPTARKETWGQIVVKSEEFRQAAKEQPSRGAMGQKARMDRVNVKAPLYGGTEATGGALIQEMRQDEVIGLPFRPRSVLDLINVVPTTANAIEYVQMLSRINAAALVAEYTGGNFGLKPESTMTFDLLTTLVKVIATYIPASRMILMDAPNLQNMIDMQLTELLRVALENQIVSGNGVGENFTGIVNTPGVLSRTQGLGARSTPTDTAADTIRKAITDIQLGFYTADGILLSPGDAEKIELTKDGNGQYVVTLDPVTGQLWRLPTYVSPVLATNQAIVGAWKIGATLWDRMETEIRVGEPNDFFLRNAVAILAELRAAFAVVRPEAFSVIALT